VRVALHDAGRLRALLDRVDAADGRADAVREIEGVRYWASENDRRLAVLAVLERDLVLAVIPTALEREVLPLAFGLRQPGRSLADAGDVQHTRSRHRFLPHGVGAVDVVELTRTVLGEADGLSGEVARQWGATIDLESAGCRDALVDVARRAPRVAFGLRELDDDAIRGAWVWELQRELAADVRAWSAPIEGLGAGDGGALATLAISFDVDAVWSTVSQWASSLDDDGRCAGWSELEELMPPLEPPTWVRGWSSFAAIVHDWQPTRAVLDAVLVLGLDDPLGWVAAVWPRADTAALRRSPAPLRRVDPTLAAGAWHDALVARTRDAIGVADGAHARRNLRRALRHQRRDDGTLLEATVDVARAIELWSDRDLDRALRQLDADERAWARALAPLLGRWRSTVRVTDAGFELEGELGLRRRP
jgi:hypothetical protein